jgi:2-iminobutanoate/2-iminopropanoate deaminase
MSRNFIILLSICSLLASAERRAVAPAGSPKPIGPYTPGLLTSKFLYVSGQGMLDSAGKAPETWEGQVRQCMENVKSIVEAAGLTMTHVVATQVYVDDLKKWPAAEKVYAEYFQESPPALTLLEPAKLPGGTLVEINAIAVRDLKERRAVEVPGMKPEGPYSAAVMAGNRLYISSITGRGREEAGERLDRVLKAAGMYRAEIVYTSEYVAESRAAGIVPMQALPGGAPYAVAAVAVKGGATSSEEGCRTADGALFCGIQSSAGDEIGEAVTGSMRRLEGRLKASGFSAGDVVASNVYLDDLEHFKTMNGIYGSVFGADPPTRTTIQPLRPGGSPLFRVSVVAEADAEPVAGKGLAADQRQR